MTKNKYPLAFPQAALDALVPQPGALNRRMRKALAQYLGEQLRYDQEAEAAQRAVAAVYLTTLRTADDTFTLAALIKASRWPWLAQDELAALDQERREAFIDRLNEIADRAEEKIVTRFNR